MVFVTLSKAAHLAPVLTNLACAATPTSAAGGGRFWSSCLPRLIYNTMMHCPFWQSFPYTLERYNAATPSAASQSGGVNNFAVNLEGREEMTTRLNCPMCFVSTVLYASRMRFRVFYWVSSLRRCCRIVEVCFLAYA